MALTVAQLNVHIVQILFDALTTQGDLLHFSDPELELFVQRLITALTAYGVSADTTEAATTLLSNMALQLKGGALTAADKHLLNNHWQTTVVVP